MHRTKNVLADIRDIVSRLDEINQLTFQPVKYTDAKGEERPMFNLSQIDEINHPIFGLVKYTSDHDEERPAEKSARVL